MCIIITESWDKMEKNELRKEFNKINCEITNLWRSL